MPLKNQPNILISKEIQFFSIQKNICENKSFNWAAFLQLIHVRFKLRKAVTVIVLWETQFCVFNKIVTFGRRENVYGKTDQKTFWHFVKIFGYYKSSNKFKTF
jgi:hypothetical protein